MSTRWSFEALAVEQFSNNKYERNFFRYDMDISQADWYSSFLVDVLKVDLKMLMRHKDEPPYHELVSGNLQKLNYHLEELSQAAGFDQRIKLNIESLDDLAAKNTEKYLDSLKGFFSKVRKRNVSLKDSLSVVLVEKMGKEGLQNLKEDYENNELSDLLLETYRIHKYTETGNRIIRKYEPVYMIPTSKFGKAQFYAPVKRIGSVQIDTFWFNLMVLWFVIILLYIALYYNILQRIINYFENPGLRKIREKKPII
jgi:hypothetical protein